MSTKTRPLIAILFGAVILTTLPGQQAVAQTEADSASVSEVVRRLLSVTGDWDLGLDGFGNFWTMAVGRFGHKDSKEIQFEIDAVGDHHGVIGRTESMFLVDIDICVYDPNGTEVGCDEYEDSGPGVFFYSEVKGTYRAVMTGFSPDGDVEYAGMLVLKERTK